MGACVSLGGYSGQRIQGHQCAMAAIISGVRFLMISLVMPSRLNFGAHPQSFRATSSSRQCGQLLAMPCRSACTWYSTSNPGMFFLISAAISLGLKVMPLMLQEVRTVIRSLGASISCRVPSMASSVQTMGRQVSGARQQVYFCPTMALWKMSTAQSVVPPPGGERYPTRPGYLRLRTSTPQRAWQYWHHSSPDFLVMPQTVLGSMTVSCGVRLGVLLPKAAMELGQKRRSILPSRAASRQLKREAMLICSVASGSFSPVAERRAARQQTCFTWCFSMIWQSCLRSITLRVSCTATRTLAGGSRRSAQMMLLSAVRAESARISSCPTCPYAPASRIFILQQISIIEGALLKRQINHNTMAHCTTPSPHHQQQMKLAL